MSKKRGYWVLFGVMVLVGAFLLVFLGSQNQLPVVPDVDAQMSNMGSYIANGSYNLGNLGSQGSQPQTFLTCQSHGSCFGNGFGQWYGQLGQEYGYKYEPKPTGANCTSPTTVMCSPTYGLCQTNLLCPTSNTCGVICGGGDTMLFCSTSMNCGSQTSLNCTGFVCGDINTMLFCPTSTTCNVSCGGGINTMLFCPTSTTCDFLCRGGSSKNPPSLPEGVGSWYQAVGGIAIPASIVNFPMSGFGGFSGFSSSPAW